MFCCSGSRCMRRWFDDVNGQQRSVVFSCVTPLLALVIACHKAIKVPAVRADLNNMSILTRKPCPPNPSAHQIWICSNEIKAWKHCWPLPQFLRGKLIPWYQRGRWWITEAPTKSRKHKRILNINFLLIKVLWMCLLQWFVEYVVTDNPHLIPSGDVTTFS